MAFAIAKAHLKGKAAFGEELGTVVVTVDTEGVRVKEATDDGKTKLKFPLQTIASFEVHDQENAFVMRLVNDSKNRTFRCVFPLPVICVSDMSTSS